jgi:hypothetical protein
MGFMLRELALLRRTLNLFIFYAFLAAQKQTSFDVCFELLSGLITQTVLDSFPARNKRYLWWSYSNPENYENVTEMAEPSSRRKLTVRYLHSPNR